MGVFLSTGYTQVSRGNGRLGPSTKQRPAGRPNVAATRPASRSASPLSGGDWAGAFQTVGRGPRHSGKLPEYGGRSQSARCPTERWRRTAGSWRLKTRRDGGGNMQSMEVCKSLKFVGR